MERIVICNHCKEEFKNFELIAIDNYYYCGECLLRLQEDWS